MIASNFRRHADAMALQLPLPFGHGLKWATSRPGARILRKIRADRGTAFKLAGRIKAITRTATPEWWKAMKRRAKQLSHAVRSALIHID